MTGFDVERPGHRRGPRAGAKRGLSDRADFVQAPPGPLPFADGAFDVVFSKDALLHVPDKDALFREIFRVLKPGGVFAASNWMIGHDGEPSPDMKAYVAAEGLSFSMASPAPLPARRWSAPASPTSRSPIAIPWYREVGARRALAAAEGRSTRTVVGGGRQGLCRQEHPHLGSHAEGA